MTYMFGKRNKRPTVEMTKLSSLIADDVEIVGDLNFSNGIRIDGRVRGNVVARPGDGTTRTLLVLSDKGHIEGTIRCGDAVINGTVVGDLDVEHFLELQSNSRIIGTVRYQHLQMDVGAAVQGQLVQAMAAAPMGNVVELPMEKSGS